MPLVPLIAAGVFSLVVIAFVLWLWWRKSAFRYIPLRRLVLLIALGALFCTATTYFERWALDYTDVSLNQAGGISLLAMMLFCAPLEEATKAAIIWPFYVSRRLATGQLGAFYAVVAAAGFAASEVILFSIHSGGTWLSLLRVAFAAPAHLFFAGVWGFTLGGARRDRFFWISWITAVGLHGAYDHIVFGRGPALLIVVVPMLGLMAAGVFVLLREPVRLPSHRESRVSLFEAPSVSSVRGALSGRGRRVMLHWIVFGAFVNLGVTFVFLAASVLLGHQYGVNFALAESAGVEGILPVALLGAALLLAFPFSAYLIARASGAESVLEPAWATGASIIAVIALFSVTEPTALAIAMGVAPVGFTLACAGAWFGLSRH